MNIYEAIEKIKQTKFYKEKIKKLFVCEEEPEMIYFQAKATYTSTELRYINFIIGEKTNFFLEELFMSNPDSHLTEV